MWKIMQENLEDLCSRGFWQAIGAEFLGTLFLVLFGCGAMDRNFAINAGVVEVALAFGLVYASLVWCFNHISGGHFNPAVTAGALVIRRVSIVRGIFFIIVQCVGAIAGAGILHGLSTDPFEKSLGLNRLVRITPAQGFGVELMITFLLVFVVLAATDSNRTDLAGSAPLSIGLAVVAGHLFAYPYTTCGMNSARSFGPAVIKDSWEHHWVYWVGPVVGGILAALIYEYIFAAGATFTRTRKFILRSRKPDDKKPVDDANSSKVELIEIQMEEKPAEAEPEVVKIEVEEEEKKEPEPEQQAE